MAISLGDINFALGADTQALAQSLNRLRAFGKEVERVSRSQAEGADKVAASYRKQEVAITRAIEKTANLNAAIRRAGGDASLIEKNNEALSKYVNQLSNGAVKALTFQRANERLAASLGGVRRELDDIKKKQHENTWGRLTAAMHNLSGAAGLVTGPLGGVASRISILTSMMQRSGAQTTLFVGGFVLGTAALYNFGAAILANSLKLSQARGAFEAISGSITESNRLMGEARGIADRAGTEFASTANQYAKFMAAAKGTNIAGKESARIFETVAKVTSKLSLPVEQTEGVFRALEQMMSKGTVSAEELRGQLGDRLVGAFNLAADAAGVKREALGDLMKQGKLVTDEFLPKLRVELEKAFHIGGDVDSFQADINRVSSAWSTMLDDFDKTFHITDLAKLALGGVANVLTWVGNRVYGLHELFVDMQIGMQTVAAEAQKLGNTLLYLGKAIYDGFAAAFDHTGDLFAAFTTDLREFVTHPFSSGGFDKLGAALENGFTKSFKTAFNKTLAEADGFNAKIDAKLAGRIAKAKGERRADRANRNNTSPLGLGSPSGTGGGGGGGEGGSGSGGTSGAGGIEADLQALEQAATTMGQLNQSITALRSGGTPALKQLNDEFARTAKIEAYADLLKRAGVNSAEATKRIREYKDALGEFDKLSAEAKNTEAAITELESAGGRAFDRLGAAISDMVSQGKVDFNSLADISRSIAADILQTFIQLAVLNPLKNMIFGGLGGGAAPTIGGGVFSSIGKIFGFARGGVVGPSGVQKMARGGLLTSPTMMSTASGPVLGGEAGTEAVMPLSRGADGKLGVKTIGGRAGSNVTQYITISTPNPQAFKASEAQTAATLRRAVMMGGRSA